MPISMPKGLKVMELSFEKIAEMWQKMSAISGLFDDMSKGNFQMFSASVTSQNSVWLETADGTGLLYLLHIVPGLSASAHFLFWDKQLKGKEELCADTLKFLVDSIPLLKVNAFIPEYAGALGHFVRRCGFKKEGRLRRWSLRNGKPFDVIAYGITREEALYGTVFRPTDTASGRQGIQRHGPAVFPELESPTSPVSGGTGSGPISTEHEQDDGPVRAGDGEVPVRDDAERRDAERTADTGSKAPTI